MSFDKIVDSAALDGAMTATADAIRTKTGDTGTVNWDPAIGFAQAIAGIASGGGGQFETGEIIGDGLTHNTSSSALQIPVSFEPNFVFVCITDTATALDANHVFGGCIVKGIMCQASYRAANNASPVNGGFAYWFEGWTGLAYNTATYSDGIFRWLIAPSSRPFYNGESYTWIAGKW